MVAWALLLFPEIVEAHALVGIQYLTKFFSRPLDFLSHAWRDRFHDLSGAFLAGSKQFVNLLALIWSQRQITLDTPEELNT